MIAVLAILFTCAACQSGNTAEGVIKPETKEIPELNIILMPSMRGWVEQDYFADYRKNFEKQFGVKIHYDVLEDEDSSKKLMTKLSVQNGPEIVVADYSVDPLIKNSAVVDLKGKVENVDKMYSSFRENAVYYVPIGINVWPTILRKEMLDELQIPAPDFSWTKEDYYSIYDKWATKAERMFTRHELIDIYRRYIHEQQIFDYQNKRAHINTENMKIALKNIRKEIYSGRYMLNESYSYENYYNMFCEIASQEFNDDKTLAKSDEYICQSFSNIEEGSNVNMLLPQDVDLKALSKSIVRPYYAEDDIQLWSLGLSVNKNGANLELAYEFVNGLLSDEVQMDMIESENEMLDRVWLYPISSNIESKINDMEKQKGYSEEALQLKQYVLQKIKNGEYELIALRDRKKEEQYWMLREDLLPFIFADKEYSDAELTKELQKLEDKYNIYLSE
jgi:ABC-type glycerol-3-phosphate transport system substrate-binding protein